LLSRVSLFVVVPRIAVSGSANPDPHQYRIATVEASVAAIADPRHDKDKEERRLLATATTSPDVDILLEIVCLLTQPVRAGKATFLVKVKSRRGEPIHQ
jgi:hypothetical protein